VQRSLGVGRCVNCGSNELVTDRDSGEVVCSKCGLVVRDILLDYKPEWRAFTPEERDAKIRVGAPTSLKQFDKGLSTTFHPSKDMYGRSLSITERLKMMRLYKWNVRAAMRSSAERNLSQAMNELARLTDTLHIPRDVDEYAAQIYRKALNHGLIRGRSIHGFAAASLYAACRLTQTPRSLKEITEASTRRRKDISKCYRLLQQELAMNMPLDDPVKYVSKIASRARLSQRTQNMAIQFLQEAEKRKIIVGKGPLGMAAVTLYISAYINGEKITQRKVAEAAEVTEVTVRNRFKDLNRLFDLGLPGGRELIKKGGEGDGTKDGDK
jgi:transcription initiation factor TFIIB